MNKRLNLIGKTFGRLTVIEFAGVNKKQNSLWLCHCECGNTTIVVAYSLKSKATQSCGCILKQQPSRLTHGDTREHKLTPEYNTWRQMRARCFNPKHEHFKYYGSRGIKVCERWLHSFENFLSDMERKPSSKHSIDRINNDGNYEPSNCRWATINEQANNRRPKTPKSPQ